MGDLSGDKEGADVVGKLGFETGLEVVEGFILGRAEGRCEGRTGALDVGRAEIGRVVGDAVGLLVITGEEVFNAT